VTPLPIDGLLPSVVAELSRREALVLEAPPGAGKTTRVPPALLDANLAGGKELIVLQPRRLATRLAAARVADERGERLGDTVGYQVRFEDVSSPRTRIRFLTEGLLTRRLVSDPLLKDVGLVVLDEFHERHLAGDLALAMLRRLQKGPRRDLKLVVMSATLDAAPIAQWLDDAPSLRSEGRRFEVAIEHLEREDERPISEQVLAALKRLVQAGLDGHVLVFLPGAAEIRRTQEAAADFAQRQGLELHVLHGDLPPSEQDAALRPSAKRKVILSTNVAETSVTIDGIAAVVDSGLARVAAHSPWSGLMTLKLAKISKASAIQRAGRAGRTRAGTCIRLYTRGDYEGRAATDLPEIRRLDFTESALALRALGITAPASFAFFEAPQAASLEAAEALLVRLGAIDAAGALTALGRRLLKLPLHPRQARLVTQAEDLGVAREGATLAALLGERDIRLEARARFGAGGPSSLTSGPSDLLELLERFERGQRGGARAAGLDAQAVSTVERAIKQLGRQLDRHRAPAPRSPAEKERALMRSVLAGYPDRVAKRRRPKAPELILSQGGSATLEPTSVVHDAELMVAVDAEDRRGSVFVRLASAVEAEWLLEVAPDELGELDALEWNATGQRVERTTRLTYGALTLEENRQPAPPSEAASQLLAEHALDAGLATFIGLEKLAAWQCRVEAVRQGFPQAGFPVADDALVRATLAECCEGLRSFAELKEVSLLDALQAKLTPSQSAQLQRETPERITLPGGRVVKVNYEPARPPWIESRLQDFFGLLKGPAVGAVPLVLHLLAPNMRAVQVTTDLAGFWDRHYPAIRRELMRQYPRHAWPEDPRTATPPPPRPPRPR
jgi:ATP-dependent helicase HrpB